MQVTVANYALQSIVNPVGIPGRDGATWRSGAGVPDPSLGNDGDFYIDTTASTYYGPKAAGSWGAAKSMGGDNYATVSLLLSDTAMTYTEGQPRTVAAGDYVAAGGFRYQVAASGASNSQVTTAGGVKLYVLPNPSFNLKAFGAKGDGVTDDAASVQKWLSAAVTASGRAYAPAGTYLLNAAVSVAATSQRFSVEGDGEGTTVFLVPSGNTTGGMLIDSTARNGQARFSGFTIRKSGTGGTGLRYTQPEGGNQHQRAVVCRDVTVEGANFTSDYFATFIDFTGAWRPYLQNVKASGPFVGVDSTDGSARYAADIGINLDGCYDPTLDACHTWGQHTGVSAKVNEATITGVSDIGGGLVRLSTAAVHPFSVGASIMVAGTTDYNGVFTVVARTDTTIDISDTFTSSQTGTCYLSTGPEAIRVVNCVLAECRQALNYKRPAGREPVVWIDNCHVNYRDNGLIIDGAKLVTIRGGHYYNEDTGNLYSGVPHDVYLKNASEFIITGNTFHFDGATDRIGVLVESDTTGEGDNGVISHNVFSGTFSTAIWLSANVTGVLVGPNVYSGTITTNVNDVSTSNAIIDGKTETTGTWTPSLTFGGAAVGLAYASRSGTYRISGGVLHYQIDMTLTAKGTSTGTADISLPTGLPGVQTIQVGGMADFPLYSAMASIAGPTARATSATNLRLLTQGATAIANMTDANFTNTTSLMICGSLALA